MAKGIGNTILNQLINSCDKSKLAADPNNDFFGLWEVTEIPTFDVPYRLPLFLYGFCYTGVAEIEVDHKPLLFTCGDIVRIRIGQTLRVNSISSDFKSTLFIFSRKIVSEMMKSVKIPTNNPVSIIHCSEHLVKSMNQYLEMMLDKMNMFKTSSPTPYMLNAFSFITKGMLCEILNEVCITSQVSTFTSRTEEIFNKFLKLVAEKYKTTRSVKDYSKLLCISNKYLCHICSEFNDKTPSQIINNQVMTEAKHLIKDTQLSIEEISAKLGFTSQSFFARFFKDHEGKSPTQFRNSPN